MKKKPLLAAVLNGLLPGLGYVYVGSKRKFFRFGLLLASIAVLFSPAAWEMAKMEWDILYWIGVGIFFIVFAADGWKDAKEKNKQANLV